MHGTRNGSDILAGAGAGLPSGFLIMMIDALGQSLMCVSGTEYRHIGPVVF